MIFIITKRTEKSVLFYILNSCTYEAYSVYDKSILEVYSNPATQFVQRKTHKKILYLSEAVRLLPPLS